MTHLDEGTLIALRDGVATDARAAGHARDCVGCADALTEARSRSAVIADALSELDEPVDVSGAKATVRSRLDARRRTARASRSWRTHLGRAAAVLLVTAGAASALPGSPIRTWWVGSIAAPPAPASPDEVVSAQDSPSAAISVPAAEGGIRVIVRGAEPGSVIEVTWVERGSARVSAPVGSTFTYADGRAEVDPTPGIVKVELPQAAVRALLEVDGRVFLERSGGRVDIPGPAAERSSGRIRFVVPPRS